MQALAAATRSAWAWRGSLIADSTADRVAYTLWRTRTRSPARVSDRNCAGVIPAARHSPAVPTVFLRTAAGTSLNVTIVSICHHGAGGVDHRAGAHSRAALAGDGGGPARRLAAARGRRLHRPRQLGAAARRPGHAARRRTHRRHPLVPCSRPAADDRHPAAAGG